MPRSAAIDTEYLLLIADISGYTRFMMKNHTARVHAHGMFSDLLSAVIEEVRVPLEVNKLQGDAIFVVAARQEGDWAGVESGIGRQDDRFMSAFDLTLTELATSNTCECIACQQVTQLLVFAGRLLGEPLELACTGFEVAAIVRATVITRDLIGEGKSNWFVGCLLLGVYAILAIGFYHLPD